MTTRCMARRLFLLISISTFSAFSAGCATSQAVTEVAQLTSVEPEARILLMTPDIKMYTLTVGGVTEFNPDATELARANFVEAARRHANDRGSRLVILDAGAAEQDADLDRYGRLHGAVALAVQQHHYNANWKLPSKHGAFDWSLGPQVAALGERYSADYGLFVTYVDMSGSGGRWALSLFAAAVGVAMPTGGQFGFASLVDLHTGRIVWVNQSLASDVGAGDLKSATGADKVIKNLLSAMPSS
jgi:hypothetical protein